MRIPEVKPAEQHELDRHTAFLVELIDGHGVDGLLGLVVLACQIMARQAEVAGEQEQQAKWKARAYNCRAYRTMARRVEGRAS